MVEFKFGNHTGADAEKKDITFEQFVRFVMETAIAKSTVLDGYRVSCEFLPLIGSLLFSLLSDGWLKKY